MPLLLTESLDPGQRELTHQHIESCAACASEWQGHKDTWRLLGELPVLEVPARMKARFLAEVMPASAPAPAHRDADRDNVVPFVRRPAFRWMAQAAAIVVLAGGSYFAGHRATPAVVLPSQQATLTSVEPIRGAQASPIRPVSYSLAETRVLDSKEISPNIEGRPDIQNVSFNRSPAGEQIGLSFDITSHVTVTGNPNDKSMVRLMTYVLENEDRMSPSSARAIDVVRQTYSDPNTTDPEIAGALAKVLRSADQPAGVRIKAAETLNTLPSKSPDTRDALIEALKSDPNPAVRIKAVEALAKMAESGQQLDPAIIETLRAKAAQPDENMYVRVNAAKVLSNIRP